MGCMIIGMVMVAIVGLGVIGGTEYNRQQSVQACFQSGHSVAECSNLK